MVSNKQLAIGASVVGGAGIAWYLYQREVGKVSTDMETTTAPPTEVSVGVPFLFEGTLSSEGSGLPNKTVRLIVDGSRIDSVKTDSDGRWGFEITLSQKGIHSMKAKFPGDERYRGC